MTSPLPTPDRKLLRRLAHLGEPRVALTCMWDERPAVAVVTPTHAAVIIPGMTGATAQAELESTTIAAVSGDPLTRNLTFYAMEQSLTFGSAAEATQFQDEFPASAVIPEAVPPPPVLVVTMNTVPGYSISEVKGDVLGITVRARNTFANLAASLRTVVGGEVAGFTKLLTVARLEARMRMIDEARKVGANAIVAMRFDCSEIGGIMSEFVAYGTAVTIVECAEPCDDASG
jgi:uncharacterized protein YbjQ (UPF0145 family)